MFLSNDFFFFINVAIYDLWHDVETYLVGHSFISVDLRTPSSLILQKMEKKNKMAFQHLYLYFVKPFIFNKKKCLLFEFDIMITCPCYLDPLTPHFYIHGV